MSPTVYSTQGSLAFQGQPTGTNPVLTPMRAEYLYAKGTSPAVLPAMQFGHNQSGTGKKVCVSIDPDRIFQNMPHIGYGQDFKIFEPLVEGQSLNIWQKAMLAPIWVYQRLTRHNKGKSGEVLRNTFQTDSCAFPHSHNGREASCSEYTALAIKYFGQTGLIGTIKGGLYGVWRIAHCNPWMKDDIISGKYKDPAWSVCLSQTKAKGWQEQKGVDLNA